MTNLRSGLWMLNPDPDNYPEYDGTTGLWLGDLTVISGWKKLKECVLIVQIEEDSLLDDPPVLFQDFRHLFIELEDVDFVPNLVAEWEREMPHLERVEVIARVNVYEHPWHFDRYYPFILVSKCGLGELHLTRRHQSSEKMGL